MDAQSSTNNTPNSWGAREGTALQELVILSSSGTTGKPKLVLSRDPVTEQAREWLYASFADYCGIMKRRCVALYTVVFVLRNRREPTRLLFVDRDELTKPGVDAAIKDFNPITLSASGSGLLYALPYIGTSVQNVSCISLVSETVSSVLLSQLRERFPHAELQLRYGTSDFGSTVGISCPHITERYTMRDAGTAVHSPYKLTIEEPDDDGVGEIVIIADGQEIRPGDYGKCINEPCTCGAQQTVLILGRYNQIPCRGALFLPQEVERVIEQLRHYINDYRMRIGETWDARGETCGIVRITVVPTPYAQQNPEESKHAITTYVARALKITPTRTLSDLIASGTFLPVELSFTPNFSPETKAVRVAPDQIP